MLKRIPEILGLYINIPDYSDLNDIGISDFNGLNITNIVVVPHYLEEQKEIIKEARQKTKYSIIHLTDRQALLIVGDDKTIIE